MRSPRCETAIQRAIKQAVMRAQLDKRLAPILRSFATQHMERGHDIRTVQELSGNRDVAPTQIYTHVLNRGPPAVASPLDSLVATGLRRTT